MAKKGARVQRLLWASTGTKNPIYSDTLYVDELIGPETINTVPPDTYKNFCDHGTVAITLTKGIKKSRAQLASLADMGIDLNVITQKLLDGGLAALPNQLKH